MCHQRRCACVKTLAPVGRVNSQVEYKCIVCTRHIFVFNQDDQTHREDILHQVLPKAW